jgi:hypothetical protein
VKIQGDPKKPDKPDPWVTLDAMAPATKHITLGTMVSPIPFYQPARLAKIVATLDILRGTGYLGGRSRLAETGAHFIRDGVG